MDTNYIHFQDGIIEGRLDVLFYQSDSYVYAYAPALDLLGYGANEEEAKASFEVVMEDFFEFGLKRGTLEDYLKKHNWIKEKRHKGFSLPNAWTLFDNNKQLQEIYVIGFTKGNVPFSRAFAC